jgi:hypothetical protein
MDTTQKSGMDEGEVRSVGFHALLNYYINKIATSVLNRQKKGYETMTDDRLRWLETSLSICKVLINVR